MIERKVVGTSVPLIQDRLIREFADRGESCEKYIYLNASALLDT